MITARSRRVIKLPVAYCVYSKVQITNRMQLTTYNSYNYIQACQWGRRADEIFGAPSSLLLLRSSLSSVFLFSLFSLLPFFSFSRSLFAQSCSFPSSISFFPPHPSLLYIARSHHAGPTIFIGVYLFAWHFGIFEHVHIYA